MLLRLKSVSIIDPILSFDGSKPVIKSESSESIAKWLWIKDIKRADGFLTIPYKQWSQPKQN